jgi:hypothetical protein
MPQKQEASQKLKRSFVFGWDLGPRLPVVLLPGTRYCSTVGCSNVGRAACLQLLGLMSYFVAFPPPRRGGVESV